MQLTQITDKSVVRNSYPELPVFQYFKGSETKKLVVGSMYNNMFRREIHLAGYTIAMIESGNLTSFVNNNICGLQADVGRWSNSELFNIIGTTVKAENMTGKQRRFLVFEDFDEGLNMMYYKLQDKGLYENAPGINTLDDLATRYWQTWVMGDNSAMPANEKADFISVYNRCMKEFDNYLYSGNV